MKYNRLFALLICTFAMVTFAVSCSKDDDDSNYEKLKCKAPAYLVKGDKIALISPAYYTAMENVEKTADVLRGWGFEPVVGPNVGKIYAGKYAGTLAERLADIRWALENPEIKAIICNRGGYGTIQLIGEMKKKEWSKNPKWLVGFSDITTIHEMETCAGVMSIHGTMSSFLASSKGKDTTSTLMRDILLGKIPRYELPDHPQNQIGRAKGTLVGGNLMTFTPVVGSKADALAYKNLILFIEEVEESMHNIDRQVNMLQKSGILKRVKGVILGEFTDCGTEFTYESVEEMLSQYFAQYDIPVLCGFPAGHGDINLPLIMGSTVTLDVRTDGATLSFNVKGEEREVRTSGVTSTKTPLATRLRLAGKKL